MTEGPVLEARGLRRQFDDGTRRLEVLRGVDFCLQAGERVAFTGASGCGKTTLLQLLGGLDRPDAGQVLIAGRDIGELKEGALGKWRNRHLSFVLQNHHLLREFDVLENVALPLLIRGFAVAQAAEEAKQMLERVGMSHRLTHRPGQLSGGERQRAAIAQALVGRPACVLLDEPTGNLDTENGRVVLQLLNALNREFGHAIVLATHDRALAENMDRILRIEDGVLTDG